MPVSYSDIKATQVIIGNYVDYARNEKITAGSVLEQWKEYQSLTLDAFVYDGKIIPYLGTFIPFIAGINVQSGSEFLVTGNFSKYTTFLPDPYHNPYILDVNNMGIPGQNGVITDGVYWCTYSTYINTDPNPLSTCLDSIQYMVYGTTGTAITNGSTYRIGEVFLSDGDNAVTYTGDATLLILSGIRFIYFTCTYQIQKRLADLQVFIYRNSLQLPELIYRIQVMYNKIEGVNMSSIQNFTSAGVMQEIIIDVTNELNEIDLTL